MGTTWANIIPARNSLAEKIASQLPDELRTKDAIANIDVRALLHQVMTSDEEGFTELERQIATQSITVITENLRSQMQGDGSDIPMNADGTMSAEYTNRLDVIDGILDGYKDGTIRRLPTSEQKGHIRVDDNGQAIPLDDTDILAQDSSDLFNATFDEAGNAKTPQRFLSQGDIMKMLQGGELDIETLRNMEQAHPGSYGDPTSDPANPGTLSHNARVAYKPVTYEGSMPDGYQQSAQQEDRQKNLERPWQKQTNDWYSVNEVLALPTSFTPEERVAIVGRLEKAGLLQKGAVIGGDTTSQAFKTAWKTLAASALERNVSMTEFLDERTTSYQETVMDSFATRLTDPARLRASGDYMAKQTLGRNLSDDEQAKMVKFLHDLERRNAKVEAGLDATEGANNGEDELDEGILADIDARMQEWITDENDVEAQAHNTVDAYDSFTKMLGGPGRGI